MKSMAQIIREGCKYPYEVISELLGLKVEKAHERKVGRVEGRVLLV